MFTSTFIQSLSLLFLSLSLTLAQSCNDLKLPGSCECLPGLTNSPDCNTIGCGNRELDFHIVKTSL